jgi:hypothetical protein
MHNESSIAAVLKTALPVLALIVSAGAAAAEESKYPDLRGQWLGVLRSVPGLPGQPSFDSGKPWGKGQGAPLTSEYEKVLEANLRAQEEGGFGEWRGSYCLGFGMPLIAYGFQPMEIIVTPETTYLQVNWVEHVRRVFTDGRDWPSEIRATLTGYSIGRWVSTNNDGRYDVLEVETRGPFKGPRHYDAAGVPLHHDNQSIFKERFFLDQADRNLLHDEITTIDHALTRPWTVTRDFRRNPNPRPEWDEFVCAEGNVYVEIEHQAYYLSADGLVMPMSKGQKPPDLRYFRERAKAGGVPASH